MSVCFGNLNGGSRITVGEIVQYSPVSLKWLGNVLFYIVYTSVVLPEHGNLSVDLYLISFTSSHQMFYFLVGLETRIRHCTQHIALC